MLREVAPRQVRLTIDLHEDDLREIHPPLTTDKSAFLLINKTAPATYLRPPPRTAPPEATRRPICPQFGQTIWVSMSVTYRRTMKQASVFSADLSGVKRRGVARACSSRSC